MHSIFWFRTRQWVLSRVLHLTEHKKQTLLAAPDAVLLLPALFRKRRISRILLVTTPGFVRRGTLTSLLDGCKKENISVTIFSEIAPDPQIESVEQGFRLYQQIQAQAILAIGGGSVLDAAKLIGARVCCPKKTVPAMRGLLKVRRKLPPLFAVPTTAGTGSEADQWGVITNDETHEKIGFGGYDELFPVLSVVDPELMKSVPPKFTAYQGFDALFHSTECYISKTASLMSDMYAQTAIGNVAKYLPRAVKDGNDAEARERVAFANNLSGAVMTFCSTTAEHSLEHAMSAYHQNLPHGAGLIMISKAFYEFFIEKHACDERFIKMAQVMGMPEADKPGDFITMLVKLQQDCGVADLKMSDYGFTPDEFDTLATNARETMGGLFLANPCELGHADCVEIFRKSFR